MTPEQLAEWAALTDAATMGPWEVRRLSWPQDSRDASDIVSPFGVISDAENMPKAADAAFIAAARAAVPALIAEVQRLRTVLVGLQSSQGGGRHKNRGDFLMAGKPGMTGKGLGGARPGAGRPTMSATGEPSVHINVIVPPELAAVAAKLGDGSYSKGVRLALQLAAQSIQ